VSDRLAIDLLLGDEGVRHALERGERVEAIQEGWQAELSSFQSRSERFRLY
jgi:uncharacterized protein YbbC (DUF1343 family)